MTIDVTFDQTCMEICPAFDRIIPMDISGKSIQTFLDGTVAGEYVSDKVTRLKMAA